MFGKNDATELETARANISDFDKKYNFLSMFTDTALSSDYDSMYRQRNLGEPYVKAYMELTQYISPSRRDIIAFIQYVTTIHQELVYRSAGLVDADFYMKQIDLFIQESPDDAVKFVNGTYRVVNEGMKGMAELAAPNSMTPLNWLAIDKALAEKVKELTTFN